MPHAFCAQYLLAFPQFPGHWTVPILQMSRMRLHCRELELRLAAESPVPKPYMLHLLSISCSFPPLLVPLLRESHTYVDSTMCHKHCTAANEGSPHPPVPLFLIKKIIKVKEVKEYGKFWEVRNHITPTPEQVLGHPQCVSFKRNLSVYF